MTILLFFFFCCSKRKCLSVVRHTCAAMRYCDTAVGDPSLTILMALEVREEGATPSPTSPNLQSLHVLQVVVYVAGSNSD